MTSWLLIDDSPEEAASFADRLSGSGLLVVTPLSGTDAATALASGSFSPAGILMDVDLSNEKGRPQTGPGLAQDMRVAQQKRAVPSFPIVRFSLRDKVLENIGRDPSSDDIFDLKIEKDGLSGESYRSEMLAKLIGVRGIYDALGEGEARLSALLGLSDALWLQWGSSAFESDFEIGDRVHLKAAPLIRLMTHPGLLIEEDVLAFRLGANPAASEDWPRLVEALEEYRYRGISGDCFKRWWARGIEEWWQDQLGADAPLAACAIGQRVTLLASRYGNIEALQMPKGSMGNRPWRYCLLTREQRQELIPVDPARAVKIKPRSPMPPWLDPLYAALGVALQNRGDPRVDKDDLKRLQPLAHKP